MTGKSRKIGRVFSHGKWIKVETIMPSTPVRRKLAKITGTWAQIPHHRGFELAKKTGNSVLAVLLALEAAIHEAHSNQVEFTNGLLQFYGIERQAKIRGLRQLADAGVISIKWRGRKAPIVTHHWYTTKGKLKAGRTGPKARQTPTRRPKD
jgi:hypothetical protein